MTVEIVVRDDSEGGGRLVKVECVRRVFLKPTESLGQGACSLCPPTLDADYSVRLR